MPKSNMRVTFYFFGIIFCASSFGADNILEYARIPELVKRNNDLVRSKSLTHDSSLQLKGYLKRSFFPKLGVEIGNERYKEGAQEEFDGNFWKLNATLNLYNGSLDSLEDKKIAHEIKASKLDHEMELSNQFC